MRVYAKDFFTFACSIVLNRSLKGGMKADLQREVQSDTMKCLNENISFLERRAACRGKAAQIAPVLLEGHVTGLPADRGRRGLADCLGRRPAGLAGP